MNKPLKNTNEIQMFMHCRKCLAEKPADQTPMAGWTTQGLQVWCNRHDLNIIHIDFQGAKHPANQTAAPTAPEIRGH